MNPRKVFRSALCLLPLALLACLPMSGVAQTTSFTKSGDGLPTGHSTVTGRAVFEDNGRPVRRVPVLLFPKSGLSEARKAVTNADGEFIFKNVAEGEYRVVMGFPGRTDGSSWENLEKRAGVEVSLDGNSSADVKLRVERGASITGKVTYPDGEPAAGAQVRAFQKVGKQWQRAPFVTAAVETDDRGIYRIYPLQAGEYIVSVVEQGFVIEERDGGTLQTVENKSITPYYYLDAANMKSARVIQVELGRETTEINLTLTERATYQLAGTVTLSGRPLSGTTLRLDARDEGVGGPTITRSFGASVRTDQNGRWSFKDVPDGVYEVRVDPTTFEKPSLAWNKVLTNSSQVTIAGTDVLNVVIALTEAGRISGTVVVEGNKPPPGELTLRAEKVESDKSPGYANQQTVAVTPKGTFLMEGIAPGENNLRVRNGKDYYVKSVTWSSKDLLQQTLKVEDGREVNGVVIELSREIGTLSGHIVTAQNRKPMPKALYILLPSDETKWKLEAVIGGEADITGNFMVSGAPGEYVMLVIPSAMRSIRSLDDLKTMVPQATRVSLKTTWQSEAEILAPAEPTPRN